MIDWESQFSIPYAQELINGNVGSARVHARILTDQYMKAIRLGAPPAIPPTLPSTIFPFPAVPIGPGTYNNTYQTRRMMFENTIYAYYQTKAILDGKANINDAIVSLKRLQRKAKEVRDEIRTLTAEARIIAQEIEALPQEFVQLYNDIKTIIEFKIQQIKDLGLNLQDDEYVTQQKKELLQRLFGQELAVYNAVIEFKPTLNPADYINILNLFTIVEQEFDKLDRIISSEDGFKKYILKQLKTTLEFILSLVPGLLDPTQILQVLADYVTAVDRVLPLYDKVIPYLRQPVPKTVQSTTTTNPTTTNPIEPAQAPISTNTTTNVAVLARRAYTTLNSLLRKQKLLKKTQSRLVTKITEKKKQLFDYLNRKIKKLREWINKQVRALKKNITDLRAKLQKSKFIKNVKEDVRKAKIKIKKTKLRIQIIRDVSQQIVDITKEVTNLLALIKSKWLELLALIYRVENVQETATAAIENAKQLASDYINKEKAKEKLQAEIDKLKTITPTQSLQLASSILGKTSSTFEQLLSLSTANLSENAKRTLKRKLNEIKNEYKSLMESVLTTLIKAQTLKKLIAYDFTLKIHSGDIKVIEKLYATKIAELKQLEADQIKFDVQESAKVQKPTFKDLIIVFDELQTLVNSNLKMSQRDIEDETRTLQEEIKKATESNKFLKNLQKKNAKVQKLYDTALKKEHELKEKQARIEKHRRHIKKARLAVTMGTAAGAIGANLASGAYLLSDNEQQLNKFIQSYYDYSLLDHRITKAAYTTELKNTKDKIQNIKKYELFATILIELFKDLKTGNFINEYEEAVNNQIQGFKGNFNPDSMQSQAKLFLRNLLDLAKSSKVSTKSVVDLMANTTLDVLNLLMSITQLTTVESKYTKRVLALIDSYESLPNAQQITTVENEKLQMFIIDVQTSGSVLFTCMKYAKKYLIEPGIALIKKIVNQQIANVEKKLEEDKKKLKKFIDKQKQKLKDKLVNVDAKVQSVMFGTAARLFWTGASWTNPAGTTFVVLSIGPFIPIKALPQDGADGMARQIGDSFNAQLVQMKGLVIPIPATAIPPFPFNGYI